MSVIEKQHDDGSMSLIDTVTGRRHLRVGGLLWRNEVIAVQPLAGGNDAAGGLGSWANPESGRIVITGIMVDVTTPSTAAATMNAGSAANAATSSSNLINGVTIGSVEDIDDVSNKGAAGNTVLGVNLGQAITFSTASGASAGMAGNAYIRFIVV